MRPLPLTVTQGLRLLWPAAELVTETVVAPTEVAAEVVTEAVEASTEAAAEVAAETVEAPTPVVSE